MWNVPIRNTTPTASGQSDASRPDLRQAPPLCIGGSRPRRSCPGKTVLHQCRTLSAHHINRCPTPTAASVIRARASIDLWRKTMSARRCGWLCSGPRRNTDFSWGLQDDAVKHVVPQAEPMAWEMSKKQPGAPLLALTQNHYCNWDSRTILRSSAIAAAKDLGTDFPKV